MGVKLGSVIISSIYGGLLPKRMAKLHPEVIDSFYEIVKDVKKLGGKLIISDMYRPWQVQADLRRRKPRLANPPGKSYHEAGLAFDFDTGRLGIPMAEFHAIVRKFGWIPISSESWHIQHPLDTVGYKTIQEAIKDVGNWAK